MTWVYKRLSNVRRWAPLTLVLPSLELIRSHGHAINVLLYQILHPLNHLVSIRNVESDDNRWAFNEGVEVEESKSTEWCWVCKLAIDSQYFVETSCYETVIMDRNSAGRRSDMHKWFILALGNRCSWTDPLAASIRGIYTFQILSRHQKTIKNTGLMASSV